MPASGEAELLLSESFDKERLEEWFWGLGTWQAKDGILRGFESGPRRHGPVKLRHFAFTEADIHFEFRLIAHIKKGESVDLVREKIKLADRDWHPVRIVLDDETIAVHFNNRLWTAQHPAVAERKDNFGFGGDSGGPEGEKAGAIEFRKLRITKP